MPKPLQSKPLCRLVNMRTFKKAAHVSASVHYRVSVLENGREIRRLPRKRNLILDAGLDRVATNYWAEMTRYAAAGTGTNPVKRDSGAVTFTRAGNVVTASAGFFEAGDVGRLIKWDTGEEAYISAYNSTVEVETADSGTIAASEGTVWYVNRTGLQAEVKRSGTYGSDSGDNETTFSLGAWTFKRTFIFSEEVGAVTYNEIGWSYANSAGNNLFGMDIITGGVSLVAGQQLKVVVELTLPLGPAAPTPWSNTISGWSTDGECCAESVTISSAAAFGFVNNDGTPNFGPLNSGGVFDGNTNKNCYLSNDSTALVSQTTSTISAPSNVGSKNLAGQTYINGTFKRDFTGKFLVSEGNSAAIRSIFFHTQAPNRTFRVLLDSAETKDSDHTLSITFTLSWSRVLVN